MRLFPETTVADALIDAGTPPRRGAGPAKEAARPSSPSLAARPRPSPGRPCLPQPPCPSQPMSAPECSPPGSCAPRQGPSGAGPPVGSNRDAEGRRGGGHGRRKTGRGKAATRALAIVGPGDGAAPPSSRAWERDPRSPAVGSKSAHGRLERPRQERSWRAHRSPARVGTPARSRNSPSRRGKWRGTQGQDLKGITRGWAEHQARIQRGPIARPGAGLLSPSRAEAF
jgi:hypothetical protein